MVESWKDGAVRAGCACYTSEAEIDRLVEGVNKIAARQN
jgi:selenocysteine lyase/cysteine desulfurase